MQAATGLHVGLRTGYCGSLTTFASWEYSLVTSLIGGASLTVPMLPHLWGREGVGGAEAAPCCWVREAFRASRCVDTLAHALGYACPSLAYMSPVAV